MRQDVYTSSTWYETTTDRGRGWPALKGDVDADCCVIGGGLAGLTAAVELSRRGRRVVLLEAKQVSWAASGRNGGFVSNGFALGAGDLANSAGVYEAKALYDLSRLGTGYVRATIKSHDPTIHMGDGMRVCIRYADGGSLRQYGEMLQQGFGETVEVQTVEETRQVLKTERYHDSLYFPSAFHIHPLRYGLLVAELAMQAGAVIHEHSPARAMERNGAGWSVVCDDGRVRARDVVVCVSSIDRTLHNYSGRAVLPVATYVAVTPPLKQNVIETASGVADTRRAGDYYRIIDEGRLLWGGRITTSQREPSRLADVMRGDIARTFPDLQVPAMDYAWSGTMAYALHKMPLIGRDPEGIWYATGFGGHGLNTTSMAGILLARAIAEGDDMYRRFDLFPARRAGGSAGRVGVQVSYWWMQARDFLDERLKH